MVKNGEQMSAHVPWRTGLQTVASGEHGARTGAVRTGARGRNAGPQPQRLCARRNGALLWSRSPVKDCATSTRYALKCMRLKDLATSESEMQSLKNEKDILSMLDHPFVVKYVKFFLDESSGMLSLYSQLVLF